MTKEQKLVSVQKQFANLNNYKAYEQFVLEEQQTQPTIARTQEHLTILNLECNSQVITASLSDGRTVMVPTVWFKRLRQATSEQLNNYEISPAGCAVHWEELDEGVSIKAFLNGLKGGCCH